MPKCLSVTHAPSAHTKSAKKKGVAVSAEWNNMMQTYEQVAHLIGLSGQTAARYLKYMRRRWPDTEEQKCRDGYAEEWAWRFKERMEWEASDYVGKSVLTEMEEGHGKSSS